MVNGKENGGEMKAKAGGNTRWTMMSFAGETLQRRWIERTALPTNKIARSTTSDELTSMFRLKNFGIEQLSEYDRGHPVKEGELVVTFAQLEYGLMIPLDKEVSRSSILWYDSTDSSVYVVMVGLRGHDFGEDTVSFAAMNSSLGTASTLIRRRWVPDVSCGMGDPR
ncbi:hypothetical protein IFM89_020758 [Coptis chinensis]|uniref:Uncharacterized protein n=1 Tax=Coptis chinensis TaxID=261450 RepID=A0A835IB76_9MAGN|nr:hypothetical protein IFM89_020758 [Coptis chinensis]